MKAHYVLLALVISMTVVSAERRSPARAAADAGSWDSGGTVVTARQESAATLLADGSVLVTGGGDRYAPDATVERYDPEHNSWASMASMSTGRSGHTATLLNDGRVLVAGGLTTPIGIDSTAEIYNPTTNSWSAASPMLHPYFKHTAARLKDGRVLVVGGKTRFSAFEPYVPDAALYDPVTNTWTAAGYMSVPRAFHTETVLADGRVLVTGGFGGSPPTGVTWANADLYNPATNSWSPAPPMATPRAFAAASLLANGDVLVSGGTPDLLPTTASAQVYHTGQNVWSSAADMSQPRQQHSSTLLLDGRVLVAGGVTAQSGAVPLSSAELYDASLNIWTLAASMLSPHSGHSGFRLTDGRVLVVASGPTTATAAERFTLASALDPDSDGVANALDNCPNVANADQANVSSQRIGVGSPLPDRTNPHGSPPGTNGIAIGDACNTDSDNDGLTDTEETTLGTCPGLQPAFSSVPSCHVGSNLANPMIADPTDTDGDGWTDHAEVMLGSDPLNPIDHACNPLFVDCTDTDGDGIPDSVEATIGSNAAATDSDGDGVKDGIEFLHRATSPTSSDTDGDGCNDRVEIFAIDGTNKVGFGSLLKFAQAYNAVGPTQGGPSANWDSNKDFNGNGKVDFADLLLFAQSYNLTCSGTLGLAP